MKRIYTDKAVRYTGGEAHLNGVFAIAGQTVVYPWLNYGF